MAHSDMEEAVAMDVANTQEARQVPGPSQRKQKPTLTLEKRKNGFEVKEGHEYWDNIPEDTKEEVIHFINSCATPLRPGSCKGQRIFTDVCEFLGQDSPKVKDLRQRIPKSVLLIFHTHQAAEGREKIRDMWSVSKKPVDWDDNVPFVDPNNGNKLKKDDGLKDMFEFLKQYFKEHRASIMEVLGLNMPSEPKKNPLDAKVEAQTERSRKELHDLKENPRFRASQALVSEFDTLEEQFLKSRTPSQQFMMASSICALSIRVGTENMPEAEVFKACEKIREDFSDGVGSQCAQPQSGDQGHMYLGHNGIQSSMTSMDFQSLSPLTGPPPPVGKSDPGINMPSPVTKVLTAEVSNTCDSLVTPTQNNNTASFDNTEWMSFLTQNDLVQVSPETVLRGMKRIASETDMVSGKKIKDEADVNMVLAQSWTNDLEDLPPPSAGMGEAIPVDASEVMKNITNNPTLTNFIDNNLTTDDENNLNEFLVFNNTSLPQDIKSTQDLVSLGPATNFRTGASEVGIIPSTVEAMETTDYFDL